MAQTELIDEHVSLEQCSKAVNSLHAYQIKEKEKFEEGQLLPAREQYLWLNVTVKTLPTAHKLKPVKIPIVHPLVDPRTSSICLITKDPQREYKDLLDKHNIKFISRVVGLEKLKGKFKPYEARRMLLQENGMFLADERVIPLLPKLLGSKWFQAKKQPIPVCLTRKDLKGELERAISSTYMNQNQGTYISIKVGTLSQKPSQIIDNIKTVIPAVANVIKGNWDNIQSLNIKTNSSVSLPIWSCTLDDAEGGRWHGLEAETDEEDGSDIDDVEEEVITPKKTLASKGKKRPSSSDEEDEEVKEKPKKKAKAADGSTSIKSTPSASSSKKAKVAEPSSAPPAPASKKSSKGKASSAPAPDVNTSESTKKKGKQTAVSKASPAAEALSKKRKITPAEVDATVPPAAKPKSEKKKVPEAAEAPVAAVSEKIAKLDLTKDELNQKRSASAGGKKKGLIVKSKRAKSAKNAVLGRKAGQE
ncbi:hypothetical protein D9619_007390 [Psilocybe cf. subviscida]|uniref:Ribosomal protein L1 n=1 Tax=Psilocybe cf. subviscida TaxID=2480587 RepID=A0A8H5EWI6_9AGAR|nr:hypothetical protein D9619_007390 [Psilocybe cf. subviscida]